MSGVLQMMVMIFDKNMPSGFCTGRHVFVLAEWKIRLSYCGSTENVLQ